MSIEAGISTASLYPRLTEQALLELCKRKVGWVEIFMNTYCEMKPKFINELKQMLDCYNIKVASLHPYTSELESMMFFTHYPRRFLDGIEMYKSYFEVMNTLGADTFVFHGNRVQNPYPEDMYFLRYEILSDTAAEFGIKFAHENVARCDAGDLSFMKRMKDVLGNKAKFVLDTKQAVRAGFDPYDFIRTLGNNIIHIHISDYDDSSDCKLVGTGNMNYPEFVNELKSSDYSGKLILELYSDGYETIDQLYSNYLYLKSCL